MRQYRLANAATRDLRGIWRYSCEHWGIPRADRYVLDIRLACQALADRTRTGRSVDDIRPGYMRLDVVSHIVLYRWTAPNRVLVVRILHQGMNIADHI